MSTYVFMIQRMTELSRVIKLIVCLNAVWIGALLNVLGAQCVYAEASLVPPTLTYYYSNQPPFEFIDKDGQASGIAITRARALFQQSNYKITFAFDSINRGVDNLHAGRYDISTAVSPTKALQRQFLVSKKALYSINLSAIRKQATPPITQIEQMRSVAYAAITDNTFSYIERFLQTQHPLSKRYDVATFSQGMRLVELDKLPYFLTYLNERSDAFDETLTVDLLMELPVHIIVSKRHPNANELMSIIDEQMSLREPPKGAL